MFTSFLNPLAIILSLSTATGVMVHDMRLDKAATTALALPVSLTTYDGPGKLGNLGVDQHTHVERQAFLQSVSVFQGKNPSVPPRVIEDKKHLLQKRIVRGHHAFDNYSLPLV